jgi:ADP-heptose:LPS heptosyltransferase
MIRAIKNTIAAWLYRILILIVRLYPAKSSRNTLLLIKPDEIGDYIIFRNLLQVIRRSDKYKNHKIVLVANSSYKSLFEHYDKDYVDEVIWLNKKDYNRNLRYRYRILLSIRQSGCDELINFIISRSIPLDDGMAFVAPARHKTAMFSDKANRWKYALNLDSYIYTQLIDAGGVDVFDSIRNSNYLKQILQCGSVTIDTHFSPCTPRPITNKIGIFLGAGNPERNWPVSSFLEATEYLCKKYEFEVYVFGGPPDVAASEQYLKNFTGKATNYAGKLSLVAFAEKLSEVRFMICVDTGPLHMAIAACCPVIGLFSGKYYKRYSPYPKEVTRTMFPIYPDFADKLIAANDAVLYDYFAMKNNTIHLIPAQKVIAEIEQQIAASAL